MLAFIVHHLGELAEPIASYGPIAVLLLLMMPLGEELILVPAGILVGQGAIPAGFTWLCAIGGIIFSDALWFFVSRHYGAPLLHKRWFKRFAHPRRLLQAKHQIEQRGAWVMVTARFVPGSRSAAIIMAGLLHMPVWKFFLAELCLVPLSTAVQLSIGWLIARGLGSENSAKYILWAIAAAVACVVGAALYRWIAAHRRSGVRAPRARADWLRRFRGPRRRQAARPATAGGGPVNPPRAN